MPNTHHKFSKVTDSSVSNNSSAFSLAFPLREFGFIRYLNLIAMSLITASVLYLVASNWFMIPTMFRIIIPMIFLMVVTGISCLKRFSDPSDSNKSNPIRQALHTVCGMMIGLTLASIGQVYQSGADSYQLFLLWSILLTPWVVFVKRMPNVGVFVLWCVVSQLALILYFSQTFLSKDYFWLYVALMNLLTVCQSLIVVKAYKSVRFIMLVWIATIAIGSSIALIVTYRNDPWMDDISFTISMFLLSGLAIGYCYRQNRQLETVIAVTGLSIAIMVYVTHFIFDNVARHNEMVALLISAIVVFAEFALLAYLFMRLFKGTNYHTILLAIGAWVAGLLFSGFMLVAWDWFSIIAGIGFLIGGVALIKKDHDFSRHLGYCLAIAGQSAVTFHVYDEFQSVYAILPVQAIVFSGVMVALKKPHWIYVTLQILVSYKVLSAVILKLLDDVFHLESILTGTFIINVLLFAFYSMLFVIDDAKFQPYKRSIITVTLVLVSYSLFMSNFTIFDASDKGFVKYFSIAEGFCSIIWFISFMYVFQRHQTLIIKIALALLAGTLSVFGYFELFILLMIIAWAIGGNSKGRQDNVVQATQESPKINDKLMLVLAVVVFACGLWELYYHLQIDFLYKSLTIFISGVLVFVLAKVLASAMYLDSDDNAVLVN